MTTATTDYHAHLHAAAGQTRKLADDFKGLGTTAARAAGAFSLFGALLDAIAGEMDAMAGTEYAPTGTELDPPSWQAAIAAADTLNTPEQPRPDRGCRNTIHCVNWGFCRRCDPQRYDQVAAAWRAAGGKSEEYRRFATDGAAVDRTRPGRPE